jgi:hypothetical protein
LGRRLHKRSGGINLHGGYNRGRGNWPRKVGDRQCPLRVAESQVGASPLGRPSAAGMSREDPRGFEPLLRPGSDRHRGGCSRTTTHTESGPEKATIRAMGNACFLLPGCADASQLQPSAAHVTVPRPRSQYGDPRYESITACTVGLPRPQAFTVPGTLFGDGWTDRHGRRLRADRCGETPS